MFSSLTEAVHFIIDPPLSTNLSCPARVGGPQVTHNLAAWVSAEGVAPAVDHNQVAKQVAAGESKAGWQAKTEISGRL